MRHFDFLDDADRERLFHLPPETFGTDADPRLLATALGATLYSPATRPKLSDDIARRAGHGALSVVVCLEDSVPDDQVAEGERNAIAQLRHYASTKPDGPLVFVRVRSPEQIPMIVDGLRDGLPSGAADALDVLHGFVLPKFTDRSEAFLTEVARASERTERVLYAMPVIESPEIAALDTRVAMLGAVRELLARYRRHVLAVRIGATDLSGIYGLRRSREHTVYDIALLASLIGDIVACLGRADDGYVVTGPVWEYFSGSERIFKSLLRESPFVQHDERTLRAEIIAADLDGLIREVTLDRANGLTGKSVIHPTHVAAVNALSVVSHEEYLDALDIVGTAACGGVASSAYGNKMNESKPHGAWGRRTLVRARAFGVAREGVTFVDLLAASVHQ